MKRILIIAALLLAMVSIVCNVSCSGRGAQAAGLEAERPWIFLGLDLNRWDEKFPNDDFERIWRLGLNYGITFYGWNGYTPKRTGSGLDFTDCDRLVPEMLNHPVVQENNGYLWFPISFWDLDKLPETYEYWDEKGWLDQGRWVFFITTVADEVRKVDTIATNNEYYGRYKAIYPKVEWMVTRHYTPTLNPNGAHVLGDIYVVYFQYAALEKVQYETNGTSLGAAYCGKERSGYISGYMDDPSSFNPDWVGNVFDQLFGIDAPYIPTFGNGGTLAIGDYLIANEMPLFLYWDVIGLLDVSPKGTAIPSITIIQLIAGMQ